MSVFEFETVSILSFSITLYSDEKVAKERNLMSEWLWSGDHISFLPRQSLCDHWSVLFVRPLIVIR